MLTRAWITILILLGCCWPALGGDLENRILTRRSIELARDAGVRTERDQLNEIDGARLEGYLARNRQAVDRLPVLVSASTHAMLWGSDLSESKKYRGRFRIETSLTNVDFTKDGAPFRRRHHRKQVIAYCFVGPVVLDNLTEKDALYITDKLKKQGTFWIQLQSAPIRSVKIEGMRVVCGLGDPINKTKVASATLFKDWSEDPDDDDASYAKMQPKQLAGVWQTKKDASGQQQRLNIHVNDDGSSIRATITAFKETTVDSPVTEKLDRLRSRFAPRGSGEIVRREPVAMSRLQGTIVLDRAGQVRHVKTHGDFLVPERKGSSVVLVRGTTPGDGVEYSRVGNAEAIPRIAGHWVVLPEIAAEAAPKSGQRRPYRYDREEGYRYYYYIDVFVTSFDGESLKGWLRIDERFDVRTTSTPIQKGKQYSAPWTMRVAGGAEEANHVRLHQDDIAVDLKLDGKGDLTGRVKFLRAPHPDGRSKLFPPIRSGYEDEEIRKEQMAKLRRRQRDLELRFFRR